MKNKITISILISIIILLLIPITTQQKSKYTFSINSYEKPVINLKGEKTIKLKLGEKYVEPGYIAYDKYGYNITKKVLINNNININKSGSYKLIYKVKDREGNTTSTIRYIDILSEADYNKKTIYLTFDDGPSNVTNKILNILKDENVKATFFVINHEKKYNYLIKREYEEGHTIGLHSYSHKYNTIYKSIDNYLNDLNKIKNEVKKIINADVNIIRFPGGSSNTISNLNMNELIKKITEKGYYYYDWNISSFDTSNISSKRIYNKVVMQLNKYNYNTNIILMHDFQNNNKTVNALKDIIKYGKENGYNFSNITKYTPLVRHKY